MRQWRCFSEKFLLVGVCLGLFVPEVRAVLQETQEALKKKHDEVFQEGRRLYFQGEFEAAKQKFHEAVLISQQIPGEPDVLSLKYEGLCYQYQDELDQALALFHEALQEQERLDFYPDGIADALNNIGWALYLKGDYAQALEYLEKAEAIVKDEAVPPGHTMWVPGRILTNRGAVYSALGNYSMAFKYLQDVLEQGENFNDKMNQTRALQYLGNLERSWGNFTKALECYEKAIRVGRTAYDQPYNQAYLVEALNNLGVLYGQQRRSDRAHAVFQEALAIGRQLGTRRLIASSLINLGNLARAQGKTEEALRYHRQALSLSEEVALRPMMGLALAELGWDWLGRRPLQRPMGRALESAPTLPTGRGLEDRAQESAPTLPTGRAQESAPTPPTDRGLESAPTRAIQFFQRALEVGGGTLSPDVKMSVYSGLANAYETLGNWEKAEEYYRLAIESVEKVRLETLTEDRKIGFWQIKQETVERAISLLHRRHEKEPQAGYDAQAFAYTERARARAFLDLLAEAKVKVRRGLSPEVQQQEQAIFRKISKIRKKLLQENLSTTETTKLEQDLARAEERLHEFQQQLRLTHPAYAALQYPEPFDLRKVQHEVLGPDTLLLEFMLGEKQSFLWAVSKKECRMVALPARAEIEKRVECYRQVITWPPSSQESFARYFHQAQRLYDLLLKPIEKTLNQYEQVVIVPDGLLHYLPFETLVMRPVTRKTVHPHLLLSNHRMSYASSASALGLLHTGRGGSNGKERQLLAYADPVFKTSFSRRRDTESTETTQKAYGKLVEITRSLYRERGLSLDPLPYTREEVNNIAALYPRKSSKVYVGPAATESSVKAEAIDHFDYLHFATHGLIDEEVPARSGVVLSLVDQEEEDSILQMNEIFNLSLNADLVVLSACQSGLGKLVRGEGVIGLTRAFMYAGASSVVVSLWNVRDDSTAEFMRRFYQHLRAGKSKPEALRQAKLDMIRSERPAYWFPYFWAPFVIIGRG